MIPMELHQVIKYGSSIIDYQLIFENRNNLAITVRPDKTVFVRAPLNCRLEELHSKLQKRSQWITKQIRFFDQFHPLQPDREYVSGENHYYMGRQYRLRVIKNNEDSVKLVGKFFIVKTKNLDDRQHIMFLMNLWYAQHACMLFDRRVAYYAAKIIGEDYGIIAIRYAFLKKRWGNYNPVGGITFNINLVKVPVECMDYVIVHELCHLVHPYHDRAFYRLLRNIIPDWQKNKEKLELFGAK